MQQQQQLLNDLKIILNSIKLSRLRRGLDPAAATHRQSVLSAHPVRPSVRPSLLKTMTDGTGTSAAASGRRMMSRDVISSSPCLRIVFLSLLHAVNLMAFFHRCVCKWIPVIFDRRTPSNVLTHSPSFLSELQRLDTASRIYQLCIIK